MSHAFHRKISMTYFQDMFKGKIGVVYQNPVMVSVCLTYSLKNFLVATFSSPSCKFDTQEDFAESNDPANDIRILPFGCSADPVYELILYTKFQHVAENVVFDSQTYSGFNFEIL